VQYFALYRLVWQQKNPRKIQNFALTEPITGKSLILAAYRRRQICISRGWRGILINLELAFDDESQSGFCAESVFRTITEKVPWRIVIKRNKLQGRR
jgi:hypothetical protein